MTDEFAPGTPSPFERIRRTNDAGNEYWSSRDFARILGYSDYRNFEAVVEKARTACFNSGQRVDDHFVEITDMIEVGKLSEPSFPQRDLRRKLGEVRRRMKSWPEA